MSSGTPGAIRRDVQGLRAIAVVAVFLFHLYPDRFSFGYLGVDVFAVISGYVVSSVVLREVRNTGSFRLGNFVRRRARRLLPVLVFVLAITTLAWLVFAPVDTHGDVVGAAVSAIVIAANAFFHARSTDYFAGSDSPLIHLWSLSMEEQFYLLLIAVVSLLVITRRRVPTARRIPLSGPSLLALSLGTLGLIAWVRTSISQANMFDFENFLFYFPVGRVWQFLAGIAVAASTIHRPAPPWMARRGRLPSQLLVFVLLAVMLVNQESATTFLSWQRIAITYLTAAAIFVNAGSSDAGVFARTPFVAIGDRSYSVYLWHVPVIGFWQVLTGEVMNVAVAVTAVAVMTEISYRLVERPFRSGHLPARSNWMMAFGSLATVLVSVAVVGFGLIEKEIASRQPVDTSLTGLGDRWANFANKVPRSGCVDDPFYYSCGVLDENTDVVLVGDSHAMGIAHAFVDAAENLGLNPYVQVATGCYFLGSPSLTDPDGEYPTACEVLTRTLQIEFEKRSMVVFVSECPRTRFEGCPDSQLGKRADTILETRRVNVENSVAAGVKLVIIQELPIVVDDLRRRQTLIDAILSRDSGAVQRIDQRFESYRELFAHDEEELASRFPDSVTLFDPKPILCEDDVCVGVTSDGKAVWANEDHLTIHGAEIIRPALEAAMRDVIAKRAS